jgi:hypothetical protein
MAFVAQARPGSPAGRPILLGRVLVAVLVVGAILGQVAPSAGAMRMWCRTDPVVAIDGDLADVFVSGPLEAPTLVTGPNQIVITVPEGVHAKLVASTLGFGFGEVVTFEESRRLRATARGIELKVAVYVPATDDAMPVLVEFAPRIVGILQPASAEGTANAWVTLRTSL